MKTLHVMSGLPGSGKTRTRTTKYSMLPHVDVADIYADLPGCGWAQVMHLLCAKIWRLLDCHKEVVIEAMFMPNSASRRWIEKEFDCVRILYTYHKVPASTCRERVLAEPTDNQAARLRLLDIYERKGY